MKESKLLKREAQAMYYDLRSKGVTHDTAMAAVLDFVITKLAR
jgi:hypothetical protein